MVNAMANGDDAGRRWVEWSGRRLSFWVLLAAVTAWKIVAAIKLDVCYDESYYHYWSLYQQLSYMDHPPLTAWAMTVSGWIFGDSFWTVRFWPLAAGTGFVLIGRLLAGMMFGPATANRAGILLLLVPGFVGNSLLMTPDTLFALFWAAALCLVWAGLRSTSRGLVWWLAAGVCTGLGLLAKYNMILVFFGLGLYWLAVPADRRNVFWGTLVCGVTALLVFSPVLIWNAGNDWMSFRYQLQHGLGAQSKLAVWNTLPSYVGGLLLVATPVLAVLAAWSCGRGLLRPDARGRFLACFFWAVVLFFGYSALRTLVQANWAMLAFFTGTILLARDWETMPKRITRAGWVLLVGLDVLIMVYLMLPAQFPLKIGNRVLDPPRMREFIGSREFAEAVRARVAATQADFVCAATHQLLGSVSFYVPELRSRLLLGGKGGPRRFPWIDPARWRGKTALLIAQGRQPVWPDHEEFGAVNYLGSVDIPYKREKQRTLHFFTGQGFIPFPGPAPGRSTDEEP